MTLSKIIDELKAAKNIVILPHISADGDALGSSLALALALKKTGKEAAVCLEEDISYIYNFLPGKQLVKVYSGDAKHYDAAVALDTGDIDRLGERVELFKSARITVNIDHHNTNSEFAFHNYVDTNSSAVGEIIYQLIKLMGVSLDTEIAECLYVAIITDTGGFRFSNTTPLTHRITADLISNGVNVSAISQQVFDSTSLQKVKLTGAAINSLELFENGKIAFITISDKVLKETGAKDEDCDGIVNIGRNIRGIEVAVMLRQKDNGEIKANFRSKEYVDVSAIANLFGGGGHKRAAGCMVQGGLEDTKKRILEDIREVL